LRRAGKGEPRTSLAKTANDIVYHLRLAVRSLRRRPLFAAVAIITISLGIGGTAAIYAVVDGVLLNPLPYRDPDALVTVSVRRDGSPSLQRDMSPPDVADLLAQSPSLEHLVGYQPLSVTLAGDGEPTLLDAARLSEGMLAVFGVAPALGRDLSADETGFGAPRFVVISHSLWRDRFGMSPDVIGRSIELGSAGTPYQIIGVAPEGFEFPGRTRMWLPHRFSSPESCGRACHTWWTIGRLAQNATLASFASEAHTIAANLSRLYPESNAGKGFVVRTLKEQIVGPVQAQLWILLVAVSVVLLIACANVANLILVRAYGRTGEFAMRAALGASRWQLTRQLMTESAVLAIVGGAVGVIIAVAGVDVLALASAGLIPRMSEITIDSSVLLFSLGLVVAVTLLISLSPVVHVTRVSLSENLGRVGRGSDSSIVGRRFRSVAIGLEVALSVVLVSGAGLLARSFDELHSVDLGFETSNLLRITLSKGGGLEEVRTFYRTLEERVASIPGVESVGSIYGAPLGPGHTRATLRIEGQPEPEPGTETLAGIRAVSPHYLETVQIPLVRGRSLGPSDDVDPLPVALVNETFVRENFPHEDPLGQRFQVLTDQGYGSPVWTIVGVVRDIRSEALTQEPIAETYVPHGHFGPGFMTLTVRTVPGAGAVLPAIRAEVRALDPRMPLRQVETLSQAIGTETASTRLLMLLAGLFAAVALTLAGVGLYGVLAYLVSRRAHEIGVRMALGARAAKVTGTVLGEGLRIVALGALVGLAASFMTNRVLTTLLYGVTPQDPWVLVLVLVTVLLIASAAMFVPAWRASRVDPVEVLRSQ
jgi:predicted permease